MTNLYLEIPNQQEGDMENQIQIRNQIPKKGENIMVANDPEIKSKKLRLKHGIPITDEIEQQFKRLSKKFKVFLKV